MGKCIILEDTPQTLTTCAEVLCVIDRINSSKPCQGNFNLLGIVNHCTLNLWHNHTRHYLNNSHVLSFHVRDFDFWVQFFDSCLYISSNNFEKENPIIAINRSTIILRRTVPSAASTSIVSMLQWKAMFSSVMMVSCSSFYTPSVMAQTASMLLCSDSSSPPTG